ncbi:MAG: acetylglutamate kinase [Oscillospiraceae bacterium]|nr:acetylglutamate kinase [Oscillospiraceae bacterium]
MQLNHSDRAQVLVEALPYIQRYYGKTVVIKYGGNAMISDELRKDVIKDIILLRLVGINVVVVHGGGPEINEMLQKTGKESKFINGLRYTDGETMDIVQMVLCGRVNKNLVMTLNRAKGQAVGLCGLDGGMLQATRRQTGGVDYGLVGDIVSVKPKIILDAIKDGFIPVISTVAQGTDADTSYNVNADTAAAKIAVAVGAEKLILLTDIRGLLRDRNDEDTLISQVRVSEVPELVEQGIISGGMIPKVECCVDAVKHGVRRTHILDGRIPHSILIEVLSHAGIGTMIS